MARRRANSNGPSRAGRATDRRLWAPWRAVYLARVSKPQRCIFCLRRLGAVALSRQLVLYAGPRALVMLNRYPYNNGHLMVAPRRHVASPELLSHEERAILADLDRARDRTLARGAASGRI